MVRDSSGFPLLVTEDKMARSKAVLETLILLETAGLGGGGGGGGGTSFTEMLATFLSNNMGLHPTISVTLILILVRTTKKFLTTYTVRRFIPVVKEVRLSQLNPVHIRAA
jgi:hypothetical protein